MGLNARLIKRISNTTMSDVAHSSAYAKVSNRGSFGADSSMSFEERRKIEQNRKLIQGYKNARIAADVKMMPQARTIADQQAILAAELALINARKKESHQEFNNKLEKGGLRQYDTRRQQTAQINRTGAGGDSRAARAARFEANARPAPKTGGFMR